MIDIGASYHAFLDFFTSYKSRDFGVMRMGNSDTSRIMRMGVVCIETNVGCRLVLKGLFVCMRYSEIV